MTYTRITAIWNGATGLPGYSRFKFNGDLTSSEAAAAAGRVRTFFSAIATLIPVPVNITFTEAAQVFDINQRLTAEVTYTPPATVQGTGASAFASPVGMVVNWTTGGVSGGRKTRGRTYLVPLVLNTFASDGAPSSASVTLVLNAAAALAAGAPLLGVASKGDGVSAFTTINGASVPKRAAVLRSRRD